MTEKPILFSAPMVRSILAGTKTQTRRIAKPQPPDDKPRVAWFEPGVMGWAPPKIPSSEWHRVRSPYGVPGNRLWVRETWHYADWTEDGEPWIAYAAGGGDLLCRTFDEEWNHRLGDIWAELSHPDNYNTDGRAADRRWRPSIHMPRWASRITLEITGVRVERLNDISESDALAEGITHSTLNDPRVEFLRLWEDINGPDSWALNPWVWVVEFRRL